jgi:hypothetical protein
MDEVVIPTVPYVGRGSAAVKRNFEAKKGKPEPARPRRTMEGSFGVDRQVVGAETPSEPEAEVVETAVEAKPDDGSTKDEIKAYLDAQGVEYTSRMTKDELLELI